MKKYILCTFVLLASIGLARAQNVDSNESSRFAAPVKGDITASILFGRGNVLTDGLVNTMPAGSNINWSVSGYTPYANMISANYNDAANMIGAEVRYFLSSKIALKMSGLGIIRSTPSQGNIPGVIDPDSPNATWIPAYDAVVANDKINMHLNLGGEYHFTTSIDRLQPYLGLNSTFSYGQLSAYDPTIEEIGDELVIVDVGMRTVELIGFGGAAVAGVDYYLMEGFYFGMEIKPVNYLYSYNSKNPGPGLEALEAKTNTFSFFTQPFLKFGFKF